MTVINRSPHIVISSMRNKKMISYREGVSSIYNINHKWKGFFSVKGLRKSRSRNRLKVLSR